MNFAPDLAAMTYAIQLAVAPVFLLTAVSGMIAATAGRLGCIIDRARLWNTGWKQAMLKKREATLCTLSSDSCAFGAG